MRIEVRVVQDYRHLQHSVIQPQVLVSQDHRVLSGLLVVAVVDQNLFSLEEHIEVLVVEHQ
tara:strand:- start:177 stop:359 length:183 start_codon:yes stop_codon:yes gene_type:complete